MPSFKVISNNVTMSGRTMSCNRIPLTKSPETPGLGCGMGASGEIRGTFPSMPLLFTEENSDLSGILQGRIQVQNGKSSG